MTKLPEKKLLDGSKLPKTTTGEMKDALGRIHDFLEELLGTDSSDTETARQKLGVDLPEIFGAIEACAKQEEVARLEEETGKRGVPVGTIAWFAMATPPEGYLKADGSAVGRQTYPDLFAAIGTTFGEGDGETTFNLPDLMGRFAEGSATPGTVKEAGLPNIEGDFGDNADRQSYAATSGAVIKKAGLNNRWAEVSAATDSLVGGRYFRASACNPIYGASDTVQPPSLTLLPCIKAFDAVVNAGQVDMTALGSEVSALGSRLDALVVLHVGTAETAAGAAMEMAVPAGAKRVCVNLKEVSTNGSSLFGIQLGDAEGMALSGYRGACTSAAPTGSAGVALGAMFNAVSYPPLGCLHTGTLVLEKLADGANDWICRGLVSAVGTQTVYMMAGSVTLSGPLTAVRLTTVNGTDAFTGGTVSLS